LAALLAAGAVQAGTPFGGDDGGFVPPDKATLTCENAVGKLASKYVACVIKCHAARAAGKTTSDAQEDACENANAGKGCGDKFNAGLSKLSAKCPGSCAVANGPGLKSLAETVLDGANGNVYCKSPSGAFLE
jgi:hypothetical protein